MKNVSDRRALACTLADRLDEAFGFTLGAAPVWRRLAAGLLHGAVDVSEWNSSYRHLVRTFPATEYVVEDSAESRENTLVLGSIVTRIPTVHEIRGADREGVGFQAWTWCFFDALLLYVTGHATRMTVSSVCPRTNQELVVVLGQSIPQVSVSFPVSFTPGASLREDFCCRSRLWELTPENNCEGSQEDVAYVSIDEALLIVEEVAKLLHLVPPYE